MRRTPEDGQADSKPKNFDEPANGPGRGTNLSQGGLIAQTVGSMGWSKKRLDRSFVTVKHYRTIGSES